MGRGTEDLPAPGAREAALPPDRSASKQTLRPPKLERATRLLSLRTDGSAGSGVEHGKAVKMPPRVHLVNMEKSLSQHN